jgi:glycosyltransferase involved in cell wall biosynthesis
LTGIWRRQTGIFRYTAEVALHLLQLPASTPHIEYVCFFAHRIHPDFVPWQEHFEAVIYPTENELLIKQVWFPAVLPGLKLDVMQYPAFPPPYWQTRGLHTVMTLHDAGPWRYPEALTWHGRLYFRMLLAKGMRTCTRVITVSEHARAEIKHFLGEQFLPKIVVIPEAASPSYAQPCDPVRLQAVRERYQLPTRYLLTVATVEPRKNLVTLLAAYRQLKQTLSDACPPLIIVGRKGWNHADISGYMKDLGNGVLFPGYVTDEDLVALYQMAMCLVFPSLYEGFGLPALEAMSAGCPVITSCVSSLPEVVGNAGLLVDPLDVGEIVQAMQSVLNDEELRCGMIERGRARAAEFSWEETARKTREVFLSCRVI